MVTGCVGVENPNIEECILRRVPEPSGMDVNLSTIISVHSDIGHSLSTERLKSWFSVNMQTSVRSVAVMSRISLRQMVGKSPMWQIIAWSTVKFAPQLHIWGMLFGFHPYCSLGASLKSPLCRRNPCSLSGRTDSHDDEPFSLARSTYASFGVWCELGVDAIGLLALSQAVFFLYHIFQGDCGGRIHHTVGFLGDYQCH